jgi:3-hydroxypropanoate dehydrogenase
MQDALRAAFTEAATARRWLDRPVDDALLVRLYETLRWAPTSANCQAARFVFVRTAEGRERLRPALSRGNLEQTMTAPVTVVIAWDRDWHEQLPRLWPFQPNARDWYAGEEERCREGERTAAMQAAYLVIAARLLGLDAGPMAGFRRAMVDEAFFPDGRWRAALLCNLGHVDRAQDDAIRRRAPRLAFDEACVLD